MNNRDDTASEPQSHLHTLAVLLVLQLVLAAFLAEVIREWAQTVTFRGLQDMLDWPVRQLCTLAVFVLLASVTGMNVVRLVCRVFRDWRASAGRA